MFDPPATQVEVDNVEAATNTNTEATTKINTEANDVVMAEANVAPEANVTTTNNTADDTDVVMP